MGIKQSKILMKKTNHEMISINPNQQTAEDSYYFPRPNRSISDSAAMHRAALRGDWNSAQELVQNNGELIRDPITEGGEIALHVAALEDRREFVSQLMEKMAGNADVEIKNAKGCTALCFAAAAGHTHIAREMVNKFPNLATIKGHNGVTPLYMAALQGYDQLTKFLYPKSDFQSWPQQDQINLLTTSIQSELYGFATKIVSEHRALAVAKDENGDTALQVLARKPRLAFSCNNNRQGLLLKIITTALPCIKSNKTHDMINIAHGDAYLLFDYLWEAAAEIGREDIEAARGGGGGGGAINNSLKLLFEAAESGNDDFLVELITRDHNLLYKVNELKQSIFHVAVLHRYVKVFNLTYELGGIKDLIATYIDTNGNNILHLAAKLAPPKQLNTIPGAALQMQREVLWYKEVEKLVRPAYRNKKNNAGETPHELFLKEHEPLMKQGEKFMKQTAKSCMLFTTLITTVVITTAVAVPGGYNNSTGLPILEKKKLFFVFPLSEAAAILSSLTSMLMFLSILTSRHSDDDFLKILPLWLVVGEVALFFSIVAMMVALCTCLLFFEHGRATVSLFLVLFASVPTVFLVLKYRLLVTILRCTYSCTWLFRSYDRLHS